MLRFLRLLRLAFWRAFEHDAFAIAKARLIRPSLLFFLRCWSLVRCWRPGAKARLTCAKSLTRSRAFFPPEATTAMNYLAGRRDNGQSDCSSAASLLTLWTASGVMISWMEGFRRCYELPKIWGLVKERLIAFLLVIFALASHDIRHSAGGLRQQDRNRTFCSTPTLNSAPTFC